MIYNIFNKIKDNSLPTRVRYRVAWLIGLGCDRLISNDHVLNHSF